MMIELTAGNNNMASVNDIRMGCMTTPSGCGTSHTLINKEFARPCNTQPLGTERNRYLVLFHNLCRPRVRFRVNNYKS